MKELKACTLVLAAAAGLGVCTANAQYRNDAVAAHVAAAQAAAGEHAGLLERLCPRPVTAEPVPARRAEPGIPPRESWYREPAQAFDNLYYVGMTEFSTWAVTTSEGIIVIDPVFDYSVEAEVVDGLRALGFDPADIRYVLVSHAHYDHAGGAKLLQERFGARVLLSSADWDLLERNDPEWKPTRDIEVVDGQKLTLGDTTLEMYLTPGHTDGTISTLIPVRDGAARHVAALWGGTAFNFGPIADRFEAYAESAARFREIATSAGADVVLSNHPSYDGSKLKLPAVASRAGGEPHPYVVGTDSVQRYLTVAERCGLAALAELD